MITFGLCGKYDVGHYCEFVVRILANPLVNMTSHCYITTYCSCIVCKHLIVFLLIHAQWRIKPGTNRYVMISLLTSSYLNVVNKATEVVPQLLGYKVIGGSRGRRGAPPPPTGSISFVFTYVFAKKCTHRRLAPPNGSAPPQQEILDPPLKV